MSDFGSELANINFDSMIGGPLTAVIKAQAQSAETTVKFIQSAGFDKEGMARNISFKYKKNVELPGGKSEDLDCELSVPMLTILPIPFIRVDETHIEFNAKIVGTETREQTRENGFNAEVSGSYGGGLLSLLGSPQVNFKTSFSHQSRTMQGEKTERTYTLNVRVRAVQDHMPAGLEKLLNILESCIREKPAQLPESKTATDKS